MIEYFRAHMGKMPGAKFENGDILFCFSMVPTLNQKVNKILQAQS
jgi:hypothetical protein